MSATVNLNELFTALDNANKTSGYDIWIPTLEKTVKFSEITTGQQKQLIRALVDNPVYQTNFIITLADIIQTNCPELNLDTLNMFDKLAIAIQLRSLAFSNKVVVKTDSGDKEIDINNPTIQQQISKIDKQKFNSQTETVNGFSITFGVPSITRELRLEKELRQKLDSVEMKNYEDVRNVLAGAYIGELAKHINSITVNGNIFDISAMPYSDAFKVIEKLPTNVVRSVVKYMDDLYAQYAAIKTYPVISTTDDNETVEITVDATFFTAR